MLLCNPPTRHRSLSETSKREHFFVFLSSFAPSITFRWNCLWVPWGTGKKKGKKVFVNTLILKKKGFENLEILQLVRRRTDFTCTSALEGYIKASVHMKLATVSTKELHTELASDTTEVSIAPQKPPGNWLFAQGFRAWILLLNCKEAWEYTDVFLLDKTEL